MAFYQLKRTQLVSAELRQVWSFIAAPGNLKLITPGYMGFDITSDQSHKKMYEGMIISYKVSPLFGIKMNWVTEITHVEKEKYFVDEQRIGPYSMWHHQHHIKAVEKGVEMQDIVTYQPPYGPLGALANRFVIRKKLNEIFDYRWTAIEEKFGKPEE